MLNIKGWFPDMIIRENYIIFCMKMEMLKISIINEVRNVCAGIVKWHPKKKRWKLNTKGDVTKFIQKFTTTTNDIYEHIMSLWVEDIRAIASLNQNDADLSKDTIPSEMIKVCINTLTSQHVTPKEKSLGHFIWKKLKTLSTWKELKDGEMK